MERCKGLLHSEWGSLPTEAECEYAARDETTGARSAELNSIAWHSGNSESTIHVVAQKWANGYGLYDMIGNVWEWTDDWYGDYRGAEITDPTGPPNGDRKLLRGGSLYENPRFARASSRYIYVPAVCGYDFGFRCGGLISLYSFPSSPFITECLRANVRLRHVA